MSIVKLSLFHPTDVVDPNRDGQVSLQEYMAFMISKETENVQTSEEIENAFRAITTHQDRAYVTKDELYAVSIRIRYLNVFFFSSVKPPVYGLPNLPRQITELLRSKRS